MKLDEPLVLIIDDDPGIADGLTTLLEDEGYKVAHAKNGQVGLDFLKTDATPRVILLDLMMPVMDGYLFRERQVRDNAIASIPVIVLTAGALDPQRLDTMNVSAKLKKPVDIDQLLEMICRLVKPAV